MYGRRIAHKIFLGYLIPLIILFLFGIAGPFWLAGVAQERSQNRERAEQLVNQVEDMRESASDVRQHLIAFLNQNDNESHRQIYQSHQRYTQHLVEAQGVVTEGSLLAKGLQGADNAYQDWYRQEVRFPVRSRQSMDNIDSTFASVDNSLRNLVRRATEERERLIEDARVIERWRGLTTWPVLLIALTVALLIGRSITLGITRPLEALTRATEELEHGGSALRLFVRDDSVSKDEIGDLERGFARMARQIEQRTALLRAQNEALGSLNRRVAALMDATNDGIIMLDRANGFSVVSRRFEHFFGLERDVLLDQTYAQAGSLILSRFRNRDEVRMRFQEIVDNPDAIADETYEILEPMPRTLRIYSAPVRGYQGEGESELLGRIFVFRDATRETMVDRMKTEFVSTVSHELRTPLTAIKGYIEIILGGQTGAITDLQREFLTMVQNSTLRLTSLINDMLDISRIESGRMEVHHESTDYLAVVRDAVQMMAPAAREKQIHLRYEVLDAPEAVPMVNADANTVTQVLMNLISNGIKYTPVGGSVTVQIEPEETFVTTCVADTGIGISETDIPRLFQKFFRADNSTTREAGGTGLGLAITKAIMERLNGSIWVDSTPGKGSRFYFTLPAVDMHPATRENDASAVESYPVRGESGQEAGSLVLLIGDDLTSLQAIGANLRRVGWVTSIASTVDDALRRLQTLRPDLIALDLMAAHFDALDLVHQIAAQPGADGTTAPVVLLSLSRRGSRIKFSDSFALLPKPVGDDLLCKWLTQATQGKELSTRCTILTVGDPDLEARMRSCLPIPSARVLYAAAASEAEQLAKEVLPDLVVVDSEMAGKGAAHRLSKLLHHDLYNVSIPFLILSDGQTTQKRIVSFPSAGSGEREPEAFAAFVQEMQAADGN